MDSCSHERPEAVRTISERSAKLSTEQLRCRSYSTHTARKYLPSLDTSIDRVFPIRSVVSSSTSASFPKGGSAKQGETIKKTPILQQHEIYVDHGALHSTLNSSVQQSKISAQPKEGTEPNIANLNLQSEHKITDSEHTGFSESSNPGSTYGDGLFYSPITIQSFGVMIILREEAPELLAVQMVSENSEQFLGYTPNQLFSLPNFCDILSESQADIFLDHVEFVRDEECNTSVAGPEVFLLSISTPSSEIYRFWCALHISPAQKDVIICELEHEFDNINPLNTPGEDIPSTPDYLFSPATPVDTMGQSFTHEQLATSSISTSQPLRIFRGARRRTGNHITEIFSVLTQIQNQLERAETLESLLDITTGLVQELTGFHKVTISQFDNCWNSLVVAEVSDPRMSVDLYKGLQFPASDIAPSDLDLLRVNKIRSFYDRDKESSRLVCRTPQDADKSLDLTRAYLHSFSSSQAQLISNLGARSSMSISINAFNGLWGFISCLSYGTVGMRVSFPLRRLCCLLSDTVSRNIERLSYTSRLQSRKLVNTMPSEANPSGYIVASSDDLLQLFDADYGALCIQDETKILGNVLESSQEILALLTYLRIRRLESVIATHNITQDFPDLQYGAGLKNISGLLFVPLSSKGNDFLCLFRKGTLTEIQWAGNPYETDLQPRKSFSAWCETIIGQAREWTESDVDTAAILSLVYGKFIRIWRQRDKEWQKSYLSQLMFASSANEVRTPLNAIIHYLEIALEGDLDPETRESLKKSHSASKSLIYVINDLLDLTRTEKGQELVKDEKFDLEATFKEATEMMAGEAKRKNISFKVAVYPGVPKLVLGDQRRVRQMFSNVISNAVQHTKSGAVTVEMWPSNPEKSLPGHIAVEAVIIDTGVGMSKSKLEFLFQELEQVSVYENYQPKDTVKERVLGLGLALVARIVNNMQGQLVVQSEEGKGSRFRLILQFKLPEDAPSHEILPDGWPAMAPIPLASDREFTLISGVSGDGENQRQITESHFSRGNTRSRSHSQSQAADRLISAMQESPFDQSTGSKDLDIIQDVQSSSLPSSNRLRPAHLFRKSSYYKADVSARVSAIKYSQPMRLHSLKTPPAPGTENIASSGVPMRSLHIPNNAVKYHPGRADSTSYFPPVTTLDQKSYSPQITDEKLQTPKPKITRGLISSAPPQNPKSLRVLVAEDDPINSKIIEKRLTKIGHTVHLTGNGLACAHAFERDTSAFDVVLMDIQMPIADGYVATSMIRAFEDTSSSLREDHASIPIFAVSATLVEAEKYKYIDAGFDGWVMKPIDFACLNHMLRGLDDFDARKSLTYSPGKWDKGGWFGHQ